MELGSTYQRVLIAGGVISSLLLGVFFYRELFPEYRIYQKDFIALENFRSTYTGEPPAPFKEGVKQIVIERSDKGPALIDRCTTCHVALEIEAYSKTRLKKDLNGNLVYDAKGIPVQEENPDYVWKKLAETNQLNSLKTAQVGNITYDVEKVLAMHPLMGRETRPFEYHPVDVYGCTSCHGGNGRGLVTDRAHGPIFDGQYEAESHGYVPQFLEKDPVNDPPFASIFNAKPGPRLLFQTSPLYVGALIQAKCVQCHLSSDGSLKQAADSASGVIARNQREFKLIRQGIEQETHEAAALLFIQKSLQVQGYEKTLAAIEEKAQDDTLPQDEQEAFHSQVQFLKKHREPEAKINERLIQILGSEQGIKAFEEGKLDRLSQGSLFDKRTLLDASQALVEHLQDVTGNVVNVLRDENAIGKIQSDVDFLTQDYQKGQALFISQGCYACHRIAGVARGGVGPELTREGDGYPWFIKESIVWPQADLKTSTMPNLRLDHDELEALMTYLLGQTEKNRSVSETERRMALHQWEAGQKRSFELPVKKDLIRDLHYGMTIFATEGCASCHRLKGYASDVGFSIEKAQGSFEAVQNEKQWFETLFPETILGSQIVKVLDENSHEVDARISEGVRKNSLLEKIETTHPGLIEGLYSNFKFALRAKNHESLEVSEAWKARVKRVLKMYVQMYGLGRLICPRPNWSGVYRSDQWLMEHFKNPSALIPRSIMPVYPFDDSKFLALTLMLDKVGVMNVKEEREVIKQEGFDPSRAYQTHCAQCHGDYLIGNGPVSEWIYPIPKNLGSAEFLRNLTKERVIDSITHGVKGTPMPPWGEIGGDKQIPNKMAVFTKEEIEQLADWLFSTLPGQRALPKDQDIPKWNYGIQDVIRDLNTAGIQGDAVFDSVPNPGGIEKNSYFIKKEFFTEKNLEEGRHFFVENCAPCHGKEGDGTGARSEAMGDAKPRMLSNADWIHSKDDLRIIRSIKYGVPGTSMTPWGDLTNPLQRLQLAVFIRSLSKENLERRQLIDTIYKSFKPMDQENLSKQQALYLKIGLGFQALKAPEEMQQAYLKLIEGKLNEVALLEQIDKEIAKDKNNQAWKKQKSALISGLAEIKRLNRENQ